LIDRDLESVELTAVILDGHPLDGPTAAERHPHNLAASAMPTRRTRAGHRSSCARPLWGRPATPRIASARRRDGSGCRIDVRRLVDRTWRGRAATLAATDRRTAFHAARPA